MTSSYVNNSRNYKIITAGSTYLDIDAYACMVAMAELLALKGVIAIAYSTAPVNYSVCESLINDGQLSHKLPDGMSERNAQYIIVDVSDPNFLSDSVPLDRVVEIFDHHVGFEEYWTSRIGEGSHIEFIGAAATLIYREWTSAGLQNKMKRSTAKLLAAAILDNTLNLTSSITTDEDVNSFSELCFITGIDDAFRAEYFSEVQRGVEADLKNAFFGDIKTVRGNKVLPARVAQIAVWNSASILVRLNEIRTWFAGMSDGWMINLIDIKERCSYFICDEPGYQGKISEVFKIRFENGVAKVPRAYLRKEIIKKTI